MVEEIPYDELIESTCLNCRRGIPRDVSVCPHCGYHIESGVRPKVKVKAAVAKKGKKGTVLAGASILILAALTVASWEYCPVAFLIPLVVLVILICISASPVE